MQFEGADNWLLLLEDEGEGLDTVSAAIKQTAIRTTEGTHPQGSEWTTQNWSEIYDLFGDEDNKPYGLKDMVRVPESLEPGDYVLSFRWDCQKTPQIWQTCANVQIV